LVIKDDFLLINNTRVWPNDCLIAPFFGRLKPEQIYSPEDTVFPVAGAHASSKNTSPSAISEGDDGACGGSASDT
jgi:hypothetical protein